MTSYAIAMILKPRCLLLIYWHDTDNISQRPTNLTDQTRMCIAIHCLKTPAENIRTDPQIHFRRRILTVTRSPHAYAQLCHGLCHNLCRRKSSVQPIASCRCWCPRCVHFDFTLLFACEDLDVTRYLLSGPMLSRLLVNMHRYEFVSPIHASFLWQHNFPPATRRVYLESLFESIFDVLEQYTNTVTACSRKTGLQITRLRALSVQYVENEMHTHTHRQTCTLTHSNTHTHCSFSHYTNVYLRPNTVSFVTIYIRHVSLRRSLYHTKNSAYEFKQLRDSPILLFICDAFLSSRSETKVYRITHLHIQVPR